MLLKCCCNDWTVVCSVGHGIHRRESLWDHEGAGCQLCPGHLWRPDGLFFRWCVPSISRGSLDILQTRGHLCHLFIFVLITDINKFLWMVRIGGSTDTGKHIKEHDYYTPTGEFRVDREGSPVLLNCLMYKMCYYRFGQVYTEASKWLYSLVWSVSSCIMCLLQLLPFVLYVFWWFDNVLSERPPGYDRVRNAEIGNKDFELDVLEEAYTTEHWLVRIYKVKCLTSLPCFIRSHINHRIVWNPKWFTGELEIFRGIWRTLWTKSCVQYFFFRSKIWTTGVFQGHKTFRQQWKTAFLAHSTEHLPLWSADECGEKKKKYFLYFCLGEENCIEEIFFLWMIFILFILL